MKIIDIKQNKKYLKQYYKICIETWSNNKTNINKRVKDKLNNNSNLDNKISILGITINNKLVGFISLFKSDYELKKELTPWYSTMYVIKEYRNKGYSKILNDLILKEAKSLGYNKVYLKTDLLNYYEKFGFKYLETLDNWERMYYIEL